MPRAGSAASVIGEHVAGDVAHGRAGLKPASQAVPRNGADAGARNEGAFRKILGSGGADGEAGIADEADRKIGPQERAGSEFGLDLAIREEVVPAGGEKRIDPGGGVEQARVAFEIAPGLGGLGGDLRVRTA